MNLLHQVKSMSLVRLGVAAVSQQYIVIFLMLLRKQDTGLNCWKYLYLMLHCQISKINLSFLLLWLLCLDHRVLVNVDKALIVGDFNIYIDNTNDALGLAFTDLINSFGVKQNVTGPTHRFNHTLDFIISLGIDLTDIDIVPQSDFTDHFLVSSMLHITDINYMALRYRTHLRY